MYKVFMALPLVLCIVSFSVFGQQSSIKTKGSDGWGQSDKYEQNFSKFSVQTYYADVKSVDTVTPMPNMGQGIQLTSTVDGSECYVHLGPAWYILRQDNLSIAKGDRVEVKGYKLSLNNKVVIMPVTVAKNDRTLFVRDEDGIPYWVSWRKK
ncbi:MAG: DNA-binding protein [Fibrobacter sp.]|nr:DNA-binding protein [Fibrobacter sp.]